MNSKFLLKPENFQEKLDLSASTYKLLELEIAETKEINPPTSLFEINEKLLEEVDSLMQKSNLEQHESFLSFKQFKANDYFPLINKITSSIDQGLVEKDFHIKSAHYKYEM
jgi:fructose-1,6-bisphosphatase